MMHVYGAEQHLLVVADTIDADMHQHSFLQVTIALQSPFAIEIEERQWSCAGIVMDANVRHCIDGQGQPLLLLLIDSTSTLAASVQQRLGGRRYDELSCGTVERMAAWVREHIHTIVDGSSYDAFVRQLLLLLGVETVPPAVQDTRIAALLSLLNDCKDAEHSVASFAEHVHLSSSRLSHLFKEQTGIALGSYLVLHKLQKAIYLVFSGTNITEAAMAAGFDSPSHFAATSKRLLGMAANAIRKDSVFLKVSCLL